MTTPERLQQFEDLGEPGQWAVKQIVHLTVENLRLKQRVEELETLNRKQEEHLKELERAAHRSAAPFRRPEKERNPQPARPGRKAGHPGFYRPKPEHIDERVHVPLSACPHCQRALSDKRPRVQYIEEIPEIRPRVTELTTEEGWCEHCQCEVCSAHPLQTSRATGAAGMHLGPRALALACDLNKGKGLQHAQHRGRPARSFRAQAHPRRPGPGRATRGGQSAPAI